MSKVEANIAINIKYTTIFLVFFLDKLGSPFKFISFIYILQGKAHLNNGTTSQIGKEL